MAEPTKTETMLGNDFDARLERKLEQLKEVRLDKSWYKGELNRLDGYKSQIRCGTGYECELMHRPE